MRHINWPYFVLETTSTKDAFRGPYTMVQSISSSASCSEAGRHPGGLIPHFEGLLLYPPEAYYDIPLPL